MLVLRSHLADPVGDWPVHRGLSPTRPSGPNLGERDRVTSPPPIRRTATEPSSPTPWPIVTSTVL